MSEPVTRSAPPGAAERASLERWMRQELGATLGIPPEAIDPSARLHALGVNSAAATAWMARLSAGLGRPLSPVLAWEHPSLAALAAHLSGEADRGGAGEPAEEGPALQGSDEPIAIVGMACRLPGAASPEAFWALLHGGIDAVREVPADRWDLEAYFDPDPAAPGKATTRWGGFLDRVDGFDPLFFSISPREAVQMDPQQRLALELSWEALEDAGVPAASLLESPTGVFFGALFNDYEALAARLGPRGLTPHSSTGRAHAIIANRVSYALGLLGPSMVIDSACSSSLVAVHLACHSLARGECTLALAGGMQLMLDPGTTVALSKLGALSPDGRCRTFDARANGYVRGEGGGVVALKRLSRALRDGDRIRATIRGSAVNNDGPSNGLTAPSVRAQQALLRGALRRARLDHGSVAYVELHGTGTPLGDPIEAEAVGAVLGAARPAGAPLLVGSVKTNLGHLEAAAGIAGLLKATLSLEQRLIPPSLHFEEPNPHIDCERLGLRVVTEVRPFPDEGGMPPRAGVSSFGYGGTNAHALLEAAPRATRLLPLDADADPALRDLAGALRGFLTGAGRAIDPALVCREVSRRLTGGRARLAVLGDSPGALAAALDGFLAGEAAAAAVAGTADNDDPAPGPVFVCAGLGSQWPGMGRRLLAEEPVFRATLERCDEALHAVAGWSLLDALCGAPNGRRLDDSDALDVVFPALVAVQIATAAMWRAFGVEPAAVIGHSAGEGAAAPIAGVLDVPAAMRVIHHIGQVYQASILGDGTRLAFVALPADALDEDLAPHAGRVFLAADGEPGGSLLCGETVPLGAILRALEARGVFCRVLSRMAAHCPLVAPFSAALPAALGDLAPRQARIPIVSTALARPVAGPELDAGYWKANIEQPVRFAEGIERLTHDGHACFLELSPHAVLSRPIEDMMARLGREAVVIPSQRRDEDGHESALRALARLHALGVPVRWSAVYPGPPCPQAAPPELAARPLRDDGAEQGAPFLLPLSARSAQALRALAGATRGALEGSGRATRDVCHTAALRRSHLEHRLAIAASTREELGAALGAFARGDLVAGAAAGRASHRPPRVAFVFPGQGSQWPGMGRELFAAEPVFRGALERCAEAIRRHAGFDLLDEIIAPEGPCRLDRVSVVQPCLFAVQVALASLWRSFGVVPAVVVGHSMGEVAAACVAGALSLDDAARVICARSALASRTSGGGAMAVVERTSAQAREAIAGLEHCLGVAAVNGPTTTVLSGDPQALDAVLARLAAAAVFCRPIKVDYASHSPQMDALRDDLLATLGPVRPRAAEVPIRSTVTGRPSDGLEMDAAYWFQNLRETVRFFPAVEALLEEGCDALLEISPHPVLVPSLEQAVRHAGAAAQVLPSLHRERGERRSVLEALGALHCAGQPIDFARLYPDGGRAVPLPAYPWQRERYWLDVAPPGGQERAGARRGGGARGARLTSSLDPRSTFWETELSLEEQPYLADHRVRDAVVLPAAASAELALGAAQEALGAGPFALEDVSFPDALVLRAGRPVTVQMALTEQAPGLWSFRGSSREAEDEGPGEPGPAAAFTQHTAGRVRAGDPGPGATPAGEPPAAIQARCAAATDGAAVYEVLAAHGLPYGPAFQGIERLWQGAGEALARLRPRDDRAHAIHPALLDAGLQALVGALLVGGPGDGGPLLPVGVRSLRVHRRPGAEVWAHALVRAGGEVIEGDVLLLDPSGEVLAEVLGLRLRRLEPVREEAARDDASLVPRWQAAEPAPGPAPPPPDRPGRWLLLAGEGGPADEIQARLEARGEAVVRVARASIDPPPPPGRPQVDPASPATFEGLVRDALGDTAPYRGVLHLLALDAAPGPAAAERADDDEPAVVALQTAAERAYAGALHLAQALCRAGLRDAPRLWLVTRGAQAVGPEPAPLALAQAPLWGLGRTLAYEHPELRCARVDLDPAATDAEAAAEFVQDLLAGPEDEEEIAWRAGRRYLGRLERQPPEAARSPLLVPAASRPFHLEIDAPGQLDRLALRACARRPPGPGEVEIRVTAAGLNFIDVMKVMGVYPGLPPGPVPLGLECAGRIVALGAGVAGLEIGDEVMAFAPHAFGSHATTRAAFVLPLPPRLTPTQAAAVPVAFATAWYALHQLGHLQRGERVLVHAAAGGVGLAAVAIALCAGAEVLATAGTPEKRAHLERLGVRRVMDSRSLAFAAEVMEATAGEGVDLVLNSLAGPAVEASLSTLAADGRFIELGKRDIYEEGRALSLADFRRRLSYHAVDLLGLAEQRPARFGALLREVAEAFERGELAPPPVQVLPVSQAEAAFRAMAAGHHLGKLVLSMDDASARAEVPCPRADRLDERGTYLITGGLGGLGLTAARWMVERGARHLVLIGRQGATTPAQREAVRSLEAGGAEVLVARADVSRRAELAAALADARARMPPLRGVIHAAGALDDALLLQQDLARFRRVAAPKIAGALHLDALTRGDPIDFFVLYASAASLLGSPGQGNYAAANAFLDALAHHRRALGLPALSVDWGPFAEVGLAAREDRGARLSDRGMRSLDPAQGTARLVRLLAAGAAQVGVVPLDARQWIEFYPQLAASARLAPLLADPDAARRPRAGDPALLDALREAAPAERMALLERFAQDQVARVLRIDPSRVERLAPLKSLGIDSLMALELRNRLEAGLGLTLSATLIWNHPTVAALAEHLRDELGYRPPPAPEAPPAPGAQGDEPPPDPAAWADLSTADLAALLRGELGDDADGAPAGGAAGR